MLSEVTRTHPLSWSPQFAQRAGLDTMQRQEGKHMKLEKIGKAGFGAHLTVAASPSLAPAPASAHGLKVLYSFCALANCADGSSPQAALIKDAAGNLYGAATGGDG